MFALVPYWAAWPFEAILIPREPVGALAEMTNATLHGLADAVRRLTIRYDNLFETDCPYSSGLHQHVSEADNQFGYQLHMHFFPPLLRSASIKKHMVGYEMLGESQRDLSPEEAAQRLRDIDDIRFSTKPVA